MNISAEIDTKEVQRLLDKVGQQLPRDVRKALSATAQQGIYLILDRTERGVGYRGKFPDYSAQYAKFRKKNGRQTAAVDFNYSGKMLSSIISQVKGDEATIKFNRATEAKKGAFLNQKRPWFGFNQTEKNQITHFFYKRLMK